MSNVNDEMRELHTLLVQAMAKKLKSGEEIKASYLDTVRKFLLDNDVRVEDPEEYMGHLQAMMGGGEGVCETRTPFIPDPMTAYDDEEKGTDTIDTLGGSVTDSFQRQLDQMSPEIREAYVEAGYTPQGRTGTEETNDGYGFQRRG